MKFSIEREGSARKGEIIENSFSDGQSAFLLEFLKNLRNRKNYFDQWKGVHQSQKLF